MAFNLKTKKSKNPYKQIWKYLHSYKDQNFSLKKIKSFSPKANKDTLKKKAKQIGYCIRQSEEYFCASEEVSLATRPLLLYYGVMCLSYALIVLKNDDNHSIDYLRQIKSNKHHGLHIKGDFQLISKTRKWKTLFSELKSEIAKKSGKPIGTFSLFYKSIVPASSMVKRELQNLGRVTVLKGYIIKELPQIPKMDLLNNSASCLSLFSNIPDLYDNLVEENIYSNLCKGSAKIRIQSQFKKHFEVSSDIFLDDVTEQEKKQFIKNYNFLKIYYDMKTNVHYQINKSFPSQEEIEVELPYFIFDINEQMYHIINPDKFEPELISFYRILFCLGTLSRYYPDIWMKIIDEKILTNEFVNTLLNIIHTKYPQLILEQMNLISYKFT